MNLRKATNGSQLPWTKEELKSGFEHFKATYGRYPTAHEIDAFPFLPSARSIQRTYGGLVNLRKELYPNEISNYTTGIHRSGVAKNTYQKGKELEVKFYDVLVNNFPEVTVHEHKVIRPGDVSCDFFIYLDQNNGVVIDIFYAESIINLINVVNIKLKRYTLIAPETFLVIVGNPSITQDIIDDKVSNRRIPIPAHINVVSEEYFEKKITNELKVRSSFIS